VYQTKIHKLVKKSNLMTSLQRKQIIKTEITIKNQGEQTNQACTYAKKEITLQSMLIVV